MNCLGCGSANVASRGDGSQECFNCSHIEPWVIDLEPSSHRLKVALSSAVVIVLGLLFWLHSG